MGGLYTWAAAVNYDENYIVEEQRQGICPDGWHIPSNEEWETLQEAVTKDIGSDDAGQALKSTRAWSTDAIDGDTGKPGKDYYGFNALGTGYRDRFGRYIQRGYFAMWWSLDEFTSEKSSYENIYYYITTLNTDKEFKSSGMSVRCIKD